MKQMGLKTWNKLIKMINGSQYHNCNKPVKIKRHFKIVTWNKGSSNFRSDNEKFLPIKTEIENKTDEILILSEAEFHPKDEADILGQFPN